MADLIILPTAYINRYQVAWSLEPYGRVSAYVSLPIGEPAQCRPFEATATNPERALQDLREAVELAEHGVVAQPLAGSKH